MPEIIELWSIIVPALSKTHASVCGKENVFFILRIMKERVIYNKYFNNFKNLGGEYTAVDIDDSKNDENR